MTYSARTGETVYNRELYVPGDAWTHPDFGVYAAVPPRISVDAAEAGDATPNSYFEHRQIQGANQFVEVAVRTKSGSSTFNVVLERSFDGGETWGVMETFENADVEKTIPYNSMFMMRLRAVSVGGGTVVNLIMEQNL